MDAVQKANSGHPGAPMGLAPARLRALHANHATQPERSGLDQPRPLRALRGPRLDAPVLDAVPDRLSADARGHQALPAGRLADRRPSGAQVLARDRGDDRSTRSGDLDVGRARARRADARGALQPRRPRRRRPPHVHDRLRRRHAGGRVRRGVVARRPLGPRPADRVLRRQQDPAREPRREGHDRGRRDALRGLWLARAEHRRGSLGGAARGGHPGGDGGAGSSVADHRPVAHRLRQPAQAGHLGSARLSPRRGRGPAHQGGLRLGSRQALLRAGGGTRALPRVLRSRQGIRVRVAAAL